MQRAPEYIREEELLIKRQDGLKIEENELLRLKRIARGAHKWHESRMRAEDKFQSFIVKFNLKVRILNKDIDRHNSGDEE